MPLPVYGLLSAAVQWSGLGQARQQQLRNNTYITGDLGGSGGTGAKHFVHFFTVWISVIVVVKIMLCELKVSVCDFRLLSARDLLLSCMHSKHSFLFSIPYRHDCCQAPADVHLYQQYDESASFYHHQCHQPQVRRSDVYVGLSESVQSQRECEQPRA